MNAKLLIDVLDALRWEGMDGFADAVQEDAAKLAGLEAENNALLKNLDRANARLIKLEAEHEAFEAVGASIGEDGVLEILAEEPMTAQVDVEFSKTVIYVGRSKVLARILRKSK